MDVPTDVVPIGLPFRIVPDPEATLRDSLHHLSALVALRAWRADGVSLTATCLRRGDAGLEHNPSGKGARRSPSCCGRVDKFRHPEKRHTTPARWLPRPLPGPQKHHPAHHSIELSPPSPSVPLHALFHRRHQRMRDEKRTCLFMGCNNATGD